MGRLPRAEVIQGERRSRKADSLDRMAGMKLALPPEFQDDKDHYYFWATDNGARVHDLTTYDDYEVVRSSNPEATGADACRRPVGQNETGQPQYAQLLRKPQYFMALHQKARDEAMKEQERQLSRRAETDSPELQGTSYVSNSTIKHGGYTP